MVVRCSWQVIWVKHFTYFVAGNIRGGLICRALRPFTVDRFWLCRFALVQLLIGCVKTGCMIVARSIYGSIHIGVFGPLIMGASDNSG